MVEITVRDSFSEMVTFKRALQGKEREKSPPGRAGGEFLSLRLGEQYMPRPWGRKASDFPSCFFA